MKLLLLIRHIIRDKRNTVLKLLSLTLGLTVGIVLLAYVTFELNYDNFYPDANRLYYLTTSEKTEGGDQQETGPSINAPIPAAMMANIPEVEAASVTTYWGNQPFYYADRKFEPATLFADNLFFRTLGIELLSGDEGSLAIADQIFLSGKMAKTIFGNNNPVGQAIYYENQHTYTVAGIFKDIPPNSHRKVDAVASFTNMKQQFGRSASWDRDDSYTGYVRLKTGATPEIVDEKLTTLIKTHKSKETLAAEEAYGMRVYLSPLSDYHIRYDASASSLILLSILALVTLVVAALNYILITVSSLPLRSKLIAIQKCNGASSGNIFRMFIGENALLIVTSIVLGVVILLGVRSQIEQFSGITLAALLSFHNLRIPLLITGMIFLLAAFIPAGIYARLPVTQIFKAKYTYKTGWKRGLIFFQFTSVSFIILLLVVIIQQFSLMDSKDLGYDPEQVVYLQTTSLLTGNKEDNTRRLNLLKQELGKLPAVSKAGTHNYLPVDGYSGQIITDETGNYLFSTRWAQFDREYVEVLGLEFVMGNNFSEESQLIVNQKFVEMMRWEDNPVGKLVVHNQEVYGRVTGVVKDFHVRSLHAAVDPVMIQYGTAVPGYLSLQLHDTSPDVIEEIQAKVSQLFPGQELVFANLQTTIQSKYESEYQLRNNVVTAFIIILLITIAGFLGYINDETLRRRKEIAIRKINGATPVNIFQLLAYDNSQIAGPAIVTGILGAYMAGSNWLMNFSEQVSLNIGGLILQGVILLLVINFCMGLYVRSVANENPVNSLHTE